jgi:hypothetical protein
MALLGIVEYLSDNIVGQLCLEEQYYNCTVKLIAPNTLTYAIIS